MWIEKGCVQRTEVVYARMGKNEKIVNFRQNVTFIEFIWENEATDRREQANEYSIVLDKLKQKTCRITVKTFILFSNNTSQLFSTSL